MTVSAKKVRPRAIKYLEAHIKALELAGVDVDFINELRLAIQSKTADTYDNAHRAKSKTEATRPLLDSNYVKSLSAEKIVELLGDMSNDRKTLELIAIHRFGVPKGSLRKWPDKISLLDKLITMSNNELTHRAIEELGRSDHLKKE